MKTIRHKFGAKPCKSDGIRFPSRLEKAYYDKLKILQQTGEVLFFLRQPCFDLLGGVKYYADFAVYLADGTVEFIDTKGVDTPIGIAKRKMVEELYPIQIKIVNKI